MKISGARILITAGPTREYIDPVRYISNASSGKMGHCLAQAALSRGTSVILVSGQCAIPAPRGTKLIKVVSAADMLDESLKHFSSCDVFIACAAVCDFKPACYSTEKIKKTGQPINLQLTANPDILKTLSEIKKARSGIQPVMVGFALETSNLVSNAMLKMKQKGLDIIVANDAAAINSEVSSGFIITASGLQEKFNNVPKDALASMVLARIEQCLEKS